MAATVVLFGLAALTALTIGIYALFHGYFDHGKFQVKQAQWSSLKQVAMVAERSDKEALGGLTYFVIVGDHLFSPAELRDAYYGNAVIFAATTTCLNLHWDGPRRLVVACEGSTVDLDHIDIQKRQSDRTSVVYENIALK